MKNQTDSKDKECKPGIQMDKHVEHPQMWGEHEKETLCSLFDDSKKLVQEEVLITSEYAIGKPEMLSEDPIENMLEIEFYRFDFEKNHTGYQQMKKNQTDFMDRVTLFSKENVLFHAFLTIERHQTLCDFHELFNRYETFDKVMFRLNAIQEKLEEKGISIETNLEGLRTVG